MTGRRRRSAEVTEDYLKAIHNAQEWTDGPVPSATLARRLGVGAPTVSETLRRLAADGLVEHERYGGVSLTPAGRRVALAMVRRHRLIETWLVSGLGYAWDEVHDEAEVLEHAVSDRFVDRLDAHLGHPTHDPHGDPIPDRDGGVEDPEYVPLTDLAEGERGVVVRVHDGDPDLLRECAASGVVPGRAVVVPTGLSGAAAHVVRVRRLVP